MEKYNIISNNCIGARFYNQLNQEFPNPFMWSSIKLSNFLYLIENFDTIDFKNIDILFTNKEIGKDHDNDKCSTIIIDNNVKLYFIHHHFNKNVIGIKKVLRDTKIDYEIIGSDILDYLKNKYFDRLSRMNKKNTIFVYHDCNSYTDTDINYFLNIKTKYKKILFTNNKDIVGDDNTIVLHNIGSTTFNANQIIDILKLR